VSVALVGAGPGDPELITVRGLARVRAAEVLVYDRLVAPELVDEAPVHALRIARDDSSQAEVNAALIDHGRTRFVVRLKGGDPFVFGRGGEEALALADAGIPFELVPGVSSIAAVPESALIPVTHRGISQAVTAFTAHDVDALDAAALARVPGTLVAFMGGSRAERLAQRLIEHGKPASTPTAVISRGTCADEHVVVAPLGALRGADVMPALVVIGDVVAVRAALAAHAVAAKRYAATTPCLFILCSLNATISSVIPRESATMPTYATSSVTERRNDPATQKASMISRIPITS
jgi:uroporphyrin-III C-methyltransferase